MYCNLKRSIGIFFLFVSIHCLNAQVDTEFWFAAPDLSASHFETCVKLRFISFDKPAVITVSQPANSSFAKRTFNINANSSYTFELGTPQSLFSQIETKAGSIMNTGLLIQSDNAISAYYANTCDNSEIYALKGRNALGTNFIVPTQYEYDNSTGYGGGSSVEIVATRDGTTVTIVPAQACVGHPKGIAFTINLNKGQAYALKASGTKAADHLFNTIVQSDKPVAVNYTDDSVAGPGADLIGDQLVPVNMAGTAYIAVKSNGNSEKLYLFPTADNTNVYVKSTLFTTFDVGGKAVVNLTDSATYIYADKPVITLQVTSKGNELGAAILPSIYCTGSREIAYKSAQSADPVVSVITKTENIGDFYVNGNQFFLSSVFFRTVPGNPDWSYAVRTLGSAGVLRIVNTKGEFHMGVFDNPGNTCSYGYFSNYNVVPLTGVSNRFSYFEGEQAVLSLSDTSSLNNIIWTGPEGYHGSGGTISIDNVQQKNSGAYIVTASHTDGCEISPDTMILNVLKRGNIDSLELCYGNRQTLRSSGYGPYEWTPTNLGLNQTAEVSPLLNTSYQVKSYKPGYNHILNGDFSSGNQFFSSDYSYSSGFLTQGGSYAIGSNLSTYISGSSTSYDHSSGDASGSQFISQGLTGSSVVWRQSVRHLNPGFTYVFSGWATGNEQTRFRLKVSGSTVSESASQEAGSSWTEIVHQWVCDSETADLIIEADVQSNDAVFRLDDLQFGQLFMVEDSFYVQVRDSLQPEITGLPYICQGETILGVSEKYDSYEWNTGSTSSTIKVTTGGDYWVRVTRGDCRGTGYVIVNPSPEVKLTVPAIVETCPENKSLGISYSIISGEAGSYNVYYDAYSKSAGFEDIVDAPVTGLGIFSLNLPQNVRSDIYRGLLSVSEKNCGRISEYAIELRVNYSSDILTQRWNDVIGVKNRDYNGGYEFSNYQWYQNGSMLNGETRSYIYVPAGFVTGDVYSVELTRISDGVKLKSCDFSPEVLPSQQIQRTSFQGGERMILEGKYNGRVIIRNLTGTIISVQNISAVNNEITMPFVSGIYLLNIQTGFEDKTIKVIIR
jgi:hypothetical protein